MDVEIACFCAENLQEQFSKELNSAGFNPVFLSINDPPLADFGSPNQNSIEHYPKILFLADDNARHVADKITELNLVFDLLIARSSKALGCLDLLARCGAILVGPWDQETLSETLVETLLPEAEAGSIPSALSLNFIGSSEPVQNLIRVIDRVARYDAPVLVSGETGTGKELVARGIHYESKRRDFPFVPVNCGALTDELLISELFGHEPGAFTDAKKHHVGLVEQASQGTLFLDEVDSLTLKAQSSLLRFLQDQEYRPLGSEKVLRSDVRIICATNRDLSRQVEKGDFREDLFYRLKILDVNTPSLRDRRGDIALLINHFLVDISRKYGERKKLLHPLTENWMVNDYSWPGNVRELENYIHRIFILSKGKTIYVPEVLGLPVNLKMIETKKSPECNHQIGLFQEEKAMHIIRFERDYLATLMQHAAGNVSEAARIAGKERRALGKLLKKHGIDYQVYRKQVN